MTTAAQTYDQFREAGCENCPFFKMDEDSEPVVDCTTPNFTGIISVMDPARSWAARWLRIGKFVPGCYTLAVSEVLSEDLQANLFLVVTHWLSQKYYRRICSLFVRKSGRHIIHRSVHEYIDAS